MTANGHGIEKMKSLYSAIRTVLEQARATAYRAVNFTMVQAYWQIGYLIVEDEQRGEERAEYGKAAMEELSIRLTTEFGQGYDVRNLRYMRQFYLVFSKWNAVRSELSASKDHPECDELSQGGKHHAARGESSLQEKWNVLRPELSWTHYRLLLRVDNEKAREWYMNEAADQNWSTRQLDRQISTLYYERLLASRNFE